MPIAVRLARAVPVGLELAAILLFLAVFNIESRAFVYVFALTIVGFLAHAALPAAYRLRCFASLSVASVFLALGSREGLLVVACGIGLIALCHVPLRFAMRVALVLAAGLGLAVARWWAEPSTLTGIALPILASMFMFRLVIYLHALRQGDLPFSPALALSYFFMIPNACFPFFPIVDYRPFATTASDRLDSAALETGFRWIYRGLIHLLLYRLVFFDLAPGELFVYDLRDLIRHILSVALLYLKISGLFHLAVGMLWLFGFRLPETHHLYFLATGLPEFWRRINIYWKDFMAKMVYFPVFASLRGLPARRRALTATAAVFVASWALHSYHVFWTEGRPLLSWQDAAFWATFGCLTLAAVARNPGHPTSVRRPQRRWSAVRAVGVLRTFTLVAVLWSLWSAESWASWIHTWKQARIATAADWLLLVAVIAGVLVVGGFGRGASTASGTPVRQGFLAARSVRRLTAVAALCVLVTPTSLGMVPGPVRETLHHLQGKGLKAHYDILAAPGYYERLTRRSQRADTTGGMVLEGSSDEPLFVPVNSFLEGRLGRSVRMSFEGKHFTTSSQGLRDREYELIAPPGTVRLAFTGASDVLGAGVADNETIDAVLEPLLDARAQPLGLRTEVLNFGFFGTNLVQRGLAIPAATAPFQPDMILQAVYNFELPLFPKGIKAALQAGVTMPVELAAIVGEARLSADLSDRQVVAALRPHEDGLLRMSLRLAQQHADELAVSLVLVALQMPGTGGAGALPMIDRAASELGLPLIDCTHVWDGLDRQAYVVSERDPHANAAGSRIIAACVADRLSTLPAYQRLQTAKRSHGSAK
jgi:D-alanyl-lipoteichoic acid acyltransferase DltB (MBOAT superfamily)